jgi:hypothetical protein
MVAKLPTESITNKTTKAARKPALKKAENFKRILLIFLTCTEYRLKVQACLAEWSPIIGQSSPIILQGGYRFSDFLAKQREIKY